MLSGKIWTLESAKAELKKVEAEYKERRKEPLRRIRGFSLIHGSESPEAKTERDKLLAIEEKYKRHSRAMKAAIVVLEVEEP